MSVDIISQLPKSGVLRLEQIIKRPKKLNITTPPLIPVSRSVWLAGVKAGKYPKPIKISSQAVVWKVSDIVELMEKLGGAK